MNSDLVSRGVLAGRTGGVFDYLSASRLNLWLKCPLAFRLLCGAPHKNFYVVSCVMWRSALCLSAVALRVTPNAT